MCASLFAQRKVAAGAAVSSLPAMAFQQLAQIPDAPTEDLPLPEGFTPLVTYKLCPPGGVYVLLFFWFLDNVADLVQVVTFVLHRDYGFAIFVALFLTSSLFYSQFVIIHLENSSIHYTGGPILGRVLAAPFRAALESAERGTATMAWEGILVAE